jgi:hypothetical protein
MTEDVVEAVARLVGNTHATGRCLSVMPEKARGIVEVDVKDMHTVEPFTNRMIGVLNSQGTVEVVVK